MSEPNLIRKARNNLRWWLPELVFIFLICGVAFVFGTGLGVATDDPITPLKATEAPH